MLPSHPNNTLVSFPRITVITPSYNQVEYLEQTIRSVLDHNYPNLEYMVVDGGSTDGSIKIIKQYADRLHWWISEEDRGQSHALNKALEKATGDVIAYINSDDFYVPHALHKVGRFFSDHPDTDFLYGRCVLVNDHGVPIRTHTGDISSLEEILDLWNVWWKGRQVVQPECFWSRRVLLRVGGFREDIVNAFDFEYWTRLFQAEAQVARLSDKLACFRLHTNQKSADADLTAREELEVIARILWDSGVPMKSEARHRLKADWLYNVFFLSAANRSVAAGDARWKRWLKLAGCLAMHPRMVSSNSFKKRMRCVMQKRAAAH